MKVRLLLMIGFISLLSFSKDQESLFPDTVAGRFAAGFFKAYNQEEDGALEQFVVDNYSRDYLNGTPLKEATP